MSTPKDPSSNIIYNPLPLTADEQSNALYNAPPSPDLTSFHTPNSQHIDLPDESFVPPGAAQPRFLGKALYDDPTSSPSIRNSLASTNTLQGNGSESEYAPSMYALNYASGSTARLDGSTYHDDPQDAFYAGEHGVPMSPIGRSRMLEEKRSAYTPPRTKSKRKIVILSVLAGLVLLILAVVIPIYFVVLKPKTNEDNTTTPAESHASASSSGIKPTGTPKVAVVTGGDGSQVTTDDGSTFTYRNSFAGYWYWDENDPFNNGARAQSWSPALNETFRYGIDKIRGVNLGGWLNTEPFIAPALFEPYLTNPTPAVDEWTLSEAMRADTANGGISQLETHYKTFITEKDFAEIAGAGLNFVRVPLGYWAIETRDDEPFLAKTSWTYFLKAVKWARKYGIRINLDLHAVPGSQNGWNHSGRLGTVNFLNGPMGYANAQRTLDYIRIIAEFISQPQYKDVVTMFGILNEPQGSVVGQDVLSDFYLKAYNIVRTAGGTGQGNGPYVNIHDGFFQRSDWANFLPNSDRITLDSHPYICFGTQSSASMSSYAQEPCQIWGGAVNTSMANFGLTNAGEFSNAVTDCGLYLNGVNLGSRYDGTYNADGKTWPRIGSCDTWTDWQNYTPAMKSSIQNFALASMDALQDYFFWTWKIGNSSVSGQVESPAWSYQLGLENGWMPKDPRTAIGTCNNANPWQPPLAAWQTGGAGAGNIAASVTAALPWPPATISNAGAVTALPSYTGTGVIPTLPPPTFVASSSTATSTINAGNGWANAADTQGLFVEIPTCSYLDPWVGPTVAPPSPLCSGGNRREEPAYPAITPAS